MGEAGAIVESVGEGVSSVKPGDHVVPGYTPQCKGASCIFCMSPKTNLCPKIRGTQGKGVMPDGTSRFTLKRDGSTIWHKSWDALRAIIRRIMTNLSSKCSLRTAQANL